MRIARGSHAGLVPEAVPVPLRDKVRPVRRVEDGLRTEPVIATKFFVPGLGVRSVDRPRLRRALDRTLHSRLTLIRSACS